MNFICLKHARISPFLLIPYFFHFLLIFFTHLLHYPRQCLHLHRCVHVLVTKYPPIWHFFSVQTWIPVGPQRYVQTKINQNQQVDLFFQQLRSLYHIIWNVLIIMRCGRINFNILWRNEYTCYYNFFHFIFFRKSSIFLNDQIKQPHCMFNRLFPELKSCPTLMNHPLEHSFPQHSFFRS